MSKELEALTKILNKFVEILLETKCEKPTAVNIAYLTDSLRVVFHDELDIIETALKQQENDKQVWENYLKEIKNLPPIEIQIKLKALEIIKEKGLSLIHKSLIISSRNYEEYREEFQLAKSRIFKDDYFYTKEEYDLLKEVLL